MTVYYVDVRRITDRMILTSTIDDESAIANYRNECDRVCKQITSKSLGQLSFQQVNGSIHVVVHSPIFTVCATSKDFPPDVAYELLNDIGIKFLEEYEDSITAVERPYAFPDFHTTIDSLRIRKQRDVTQKSMSALQSQLSQVEQSMSNNIRSAIARDSKLNEVGNMSQDLNHSSEIFVKKTKDLNRLHLWRTYGRPATIVGIVAIVYFLVSLII